MHDYSTIEFRQVSKQFDHNERVTPVLFDVDIKIEEGEFVIIYGPSGSGKSTILSVMIGLEPPSTGRVFFQRQDLYQLTEDERAHTRNGRIGMVYQQPIWVKSLNCLENVALPLSFSGDDQVAAKTAKKAIDLVGLAEQAHQPPTELSGGEQQRIAIARALIANPAVIVADEPTGNLDTHNADQVMQLFQRLNREFNRTIVIVTHNLEYLPYATKTIEILDGRVKAVKNLAPKDRAREEKSKVNILENK